MTHDIDLCNWLMDGVPVVSDSSVKTVRSDQFDMAQGTLSYEGGRIATLTASRVADEGRRVMDIYYPNGLVSIDFNAKTLTNHTPFDLNEDFADHPDVKDSLAAGLNEFVLAIIEKRRPFIGAEDGLNAVEVAVRIDEGT